VKRNAAIYRESRGEIPCGIMYDESNDTLIIVLEAYFVDFKKAAEKAHQLLKDKLTKDKGVQHSGLVVFLSESGGDFPLKKDEYVFVNGEVYRKTIQDKSL